jgi:antitoxin MazE
MRTQVQKWGDSLVIRIPNAFAAEIGLDLEQEVELTLSDGKLLLVPVMQPALTLEALLTDITPDNLHAEVDTDITPDNLHAEVDSDEPVGNEMW